MGKKLLPSGLTDRAERFCREYIKDLNGKQSAIRSGYSEKTAEFTASRLLSQDKVKQFVQVLLKPMHKKFEIQADDVLCELARIAYSDIREIFNEDGSMKDPKDWPDGIARCIQSIEVDELFEGFGRDRVQVGVTKKVKLWSKDKCLEMLAKYKKLLSDVTINLNTGLSDRMDAALKRLEQKDKK